jgi:DNA-binding SARP family transcriptional activator/tetratricopeptide (TPR) repeat protein
VARFRIRTFGGLQVLDAQDRPVVVPARKPAALLAYLAMQPGKEQPRSRLASLLWGSSGEAASRASLRQALLVVRRSLALGDDELVAGPGETITLAAGTASVDALDLEASAAADSGEPEPVGSLLASIDGEFLEGLDLHESAFDDWLALRRVQLRERLARAHAQVLEACRARGAIDAATASALRLLALDPLREEVHRTLMELYAAQRRWGASLHQYQLCRDMLARELGVRPQPSTLQLRDAIERQRARNDDGASAPVEAPAPGSAELRRVSLLAVESSRAAGEADPERAQLLVDGAQRIACEVIDRFGGAVERRAGGGLLACFGAPIGHGDDEERAARCALRLVEERPDLRVGLAAGLVLLAPNPERRATPIGGGEVAGLASRLLHAAGAGEVLVAEALWRSLSPMADGQPVPDAALPSALRGVGVRRLAALRRRPERHAALVGRRAERAQFATLVQSCAGSGTGSMLHLRGEPGIGKSRLVDEFRALAMAQGFAVHIGTVIGFGSGPERDAVRHVVRDLLGLDMAATDESTVAAGIGAARTAGLIDAEDEAALHTLMRLPPPARLREIVDAMDHSSRVRMQREALARLAVRSASRRPRLVVLEDLHWADGDTLSFVAALVGATSSAPMLLVTSARSDGDPLDDAWRQATGASAVATLDLGPLRWVEASTLAAQLADASDPFTLSCVDRAGGNPLFLEQLLLADRAPGAALPASVQSVVQARLDRLAAPEREAVRVASVLGQRFTLAALDHLLGGAESWDPKRAKGLLRTDGAEGVFAHALVRDGAYASLPRARRRELHAKAALWFGGRDAVLRAEQLEGAEDPAAAEAWLVAARAEAAAHRHERACDLARRALARAEDDSARFALACCEAEALHQLGHNADAHAAWQRALAAASDDAGRCQALIGMASALRLRDDLDGAAAALQHAAQLANRLGLDEMLARVHWLRGNLLFPRGDLDGCRLEHGACLDLARRAGSIELEAAALGGLGDAEYLRGHMLSAERRFSNCVALACRHGLRRVEAANRPMAAWTRWFAGDLEGTLAEIDLGIANARAIGHLRAEAIAHHIGCLARGALDEPDRARQHAQQSLDLARRLEAPRFEAEALAFLGDLDAMTGDVEQGLRRLHAAIALARTSGMAFMGPVYLGLLARIAADDGVTRCAALGEAEQLLAGNGLAHNHLLFRRIAIDVCHVTVEPEAMRLHAQRLEERTRAEPMPWSSFTARRARALADALDGRDGESLHARCAALIDEGNAIGLRRDTAALRSVLAAGAGAVARPQ